MGRRAPSSARAFSSKASCQAEESLGAHAAHDADHVRVRLEDARRAVVFEDTVAIPRWVRGEFHGKGPGTLGEYTIDGHVIPQAEEAFVVRVPDIADATLVLESGRIPRRGTDRSRRRRR